MKFVNNISELQQNNLSRFERPYYEKIINPQDVLLQGNLPMQEANAYSIKVSLLDCSGDEIIADVTSFFKWSFGTSIYNFRYFNLQLKDAYDIDFNVIWSAPFADLDCFILRVEVKNAGAVVFDKITELYQKTTLNKCGLKLIQFETTFNCLDNVTGFYYGDARSPLGIIDNDPSVVYENKIWLAAQFKIQPTDIKKEKTFAGKTQKVDYAPLFLLTGLEPFPEWKMRELERMFTGKRIFINGSEIIWKGGKVFEKDTIRCTSSWLLKTELEGLPLTNEFSCVDACAFLCSFFVVPAGKKDQPYYNENGEIIGYFFADLINYYLSYPDVTAVTDLGISPDLNCEPVAILKIEAFGNIPNFFYYGSSGVQDRVYAKRDDCQNPTKLCDGIEGKCFPPVGITSSTSEMWDCEPASLITSEIIDLNDWIDCTLEDLGNWEAQAGSFAKHNPTTGRVQITFVSRNPDKTDPNDYFIANEPILRLGAGCRPNTLKLIDPVNTAGLPNTMQLTVDTNGDVKVTGELIISGSYGELSLPLIEFSKI